MSINAKDFITQNPPKNTNTNSVTYSKYKQEADDLMKRSKKLNSPFGIALATIRGIPKAVLQVNQKSREFIHDIARAPGRAMGSIATDVASLVSEKRGKGPITKMTPRNGITQFVFGNEEITSVTKKIENFQNKLVEMGISKKLAQGVAPVGVVGMLALDLTPGGSGEKQVSKKIWGFLGKHSDDKVVRETLEEGFKAFKHVEFSDDIVRKVAGESDPGKIMKMVDNYLTLETVKATSPNTYARVGRMGDDEVRDAIMGLKSDEFVSSKGGINMEIFDNVEKLKVGIEKGVDTAEDMREMREALAVLFSKTRQASKTKAGVRTFASDSRFDATIEEMAQIDARRKFLGVDTYRVSSFDEMRRAANDLGFEDEVALLRDIRSKRITDKEVVALSDVINQKAVDIVDLTKKIEASPGDTRLLQRQLDEAEKLQDTAIRKLAEGGTEAGRAVVAFRVLANRTLDPSFWLTKAVKIKGGVRLTTEERSALLQLLEEKNRGGVATFLSMLREPSKAEMAITIWKAGLLTSPTTHAANILGTGVMSALMTASDVASTSFDVLAALVTGKRTTTIGFSTIAAKFRGTREGLGLAKDYFKTGVYPAELLAKYDIPRNVNFKNKFLNKYTQSIFRSLGAEDIVFRQGAMAEALEKSAIVSAKNLGLKGQARADHIRKLLSEPTNEMVLNAIDAAEYTTFQKTNALSSAIAGGKRATNEEVRTAVEIVMPFTRTPTNIAEAMLDFSPLGFIRALARQVKPTTRGQKDLVERLGRATTGTGILAFGGYLAHKGLMTGSAPSNYSERQDFYASGKQPHSVYIGNKWYRLDRLSPIGNLLALGAEMNDAAEGATLAGFATESAFSATKILTEQTFLKGASNALKAISEPDKSAEYFLEGTVGSAIPAVVGRSARMIDPNLRVSDGILERLKSRTPGLSDELPVQRDIFGNAVVAPSGRYALIDPFSVSVAKDNPVLKEAEKVGFTIGLPSETVEGVRLDTREYSSYQKIQGKILETQLKKLIESDEYKGLANVDKERAFRAVRRQVRDEVSDLVFPALMINRYDLPKDVNPQFLRLIFKELVGNETFEKASDAKKKKVIEAFLEKAGQ